MKIKSPHFKKQYDLNKAQLIGQGNFAQVYRIFDSEFNDSIAIRKVKKSQADMEDIIKQQHINEELRKVENENILKIYDIIDQPEIVWYITEYCSGGSLWDALNLCKDNKMGQKQALECILQVSKGIQELHNHRITHRDLKPENILLKSKNVVGKPLPLIKLADFGLSTQKIIMETIAGTKEYIAPQQAKFHNYTNAVDVWSLGIIFDEILHGTPFYSGEDNKEVFNKILKMPFKIRDQTIRHSIKQLLQSLLKKKPYERPIIAVIKSTIQKILEEIQLESEKVPENHFEKNKKSKSSNQINKLPDFIKNSSEAKLNSANNSVNNSSKENIFKVQTRKVYESSSVEPDDEQKLQKTLKSNFSPDLTPTGRPKHHLVKDEYSSTGKNPIVIPKIQIKTDIKDRIISTNYRQRLEKGGKNKSIVDQILNFEKKDETKKEEIKREEIKKEQLKKQEVKKQEPKKEEVKIDKIIHPKHQTPQKITPIHEKISLYKLERKKVVTSHIKKEEFKHEIIDVNTYKVRIFNSKKQLLQKQLKLQKIPAFLPNTQLSSNDFQQIKGITDQVLPNFKKKINVLNYFNSTQDYEIRLTTTGNSLTVNKEICLEQLQNIQDNIKRIFQQQVDNYIDQYIQKILK